MGAVNVALPRIEWDQPRDGECFTLAALGQRQAPQWLLVHGITLHGGLHAHAWLERELPGHDFVYDPIADNFFQRVDYYVHGRAIAIVRYRGRAR